MSKHKRLKAARRKQHNTTAKVRAREWAEQCAARRQKADEIRAQILATASELKISEPLPPTDPLSKLLDGFLDGGKLPAGLYHPDGTLDIFKIATRVKSLGGLAFIDTEGPIKSREVSS